MVTEAKDTMNKAFDTFNDGFKAAVDCTQRSQETWFNYMRNAVRQPGDVDRVVQRSERMVREWMPFVGGTMNTLAKAYDTNFRAGMDVFKTYCDGLSRGEAADMGKTTRQVWDAAFEAVRTNFDVITRVSARTLENCASFCETAFADDTNGRQPQASRPTTKTEKSNNN